MLFFQNIFEYDYWTNSQEFSALKDCRKVDQKTLKLMAHILGSEFVWLARLNRDFPEGILFGRNGLLKTVRSPWKKSNKTGLTF